MQCFYESAFTGKWAIFNEWILIALPNIFFFFFRVNKIVAAQHIGTEKAHSNG